MNRLLIKITAAILSAAMVLSGMGSFPAAMTDLYVYAGDDDDDDEKNKHNASSADVNVSGKHLDVDTSAGEWHALEVSTGTLPGDSVKSIIIEYTDVNGLMHRQVLTPSRDDYLSTLESSAQLIDGAANSKIKVTDLSGSEKSKAALYIPYTGSRYATFSAFAAGLPSTSGISPYLKAGCAAADTLIKTNEAFNDMFKSIGDVASDAPFRSNSVETIFFKTEYDMHRLDYLSFYCEGTGENSWSLTSWTLYYISPDSIINGFPQMDLYSGAFVAGSLAMDFNGMAMVFSNAQGLEDGLGFVNAGMFMFEQNGLQTNFNGTVNPYSFIYADSSKNKVKGEYTFLNFSVNIMDSYGAGIESFNKLPGSSLELQEMLTAEILYKDVNGCNKSISLPVFTNAIMEYVTDSSGAYSGLQKNMGNYLSFAQQGDSVVFSVAFKDFGSLTSITFNYNNPFDDYDTLIIEDVTVYMNGGSRDAIRKDYYTLKDLDSNGNPITINAEMKSNAILAYKTKPVVGGSVLENFDSQKTLYFENVGGGADTDTRNYDNTYMVTIETSNVNFADTTDEVIVSFLYSNTLGKEMQSDDYSLLDCCKDYYGYNPGVDGEGKVVDGNYNYCMRQGGTLKFFIEIKNLDHFTGMIVKLGEGCTDDWQMNSVTVSKVAKIGSRTVETISAVEARQYSKADAMPNGVYGGVTINRVYDRNVTAVETYKSETKIYIQKGVTETVDLEEGHYSSDTEHRDMSEYFYEMDYETAMSELHFDERAWKYQVTVNVQKNSVSATTTDDCGSNNLFYFQLIFEKGKSGYVLANQQLQHDCFRAGQGESFIVAINENLGELVSINIIPDDTTAESSRMDKLCIDYIEVVKSNPDTANKRYVCENVGWIRTEYRDDLEDSEKEGRNEAEVVTSIPVDYSGYMLSLEFSLALDSYTSADKTTGEQFVGGMKCNVAYQTSTGETRTTGDLDMVSLMYEYAGRIGVTDDTYGTLSDPSFMFRPNKINRFVVDLSDAKNIISITLSGKPQTTCKLPIAGISIKILKSDGGLVINDAGEFQKIYSVEPALLTDSIPSRTFPHNFDFYSGTYTPYTFVFEGGELPELDTDESINSIVSRLPQSCNDTLNLYIYMKGGVPAPSDDTYNLKARISYSSISTTNSYVNECSKLKVKKENGRTVLYAQGLSASNMSVLTNLKLTGIDKTSDERYGKAQMSDIKVDYAIVQQVRSGVTINTFKVYFASPDIFSFGGALMSAKSSADSLGYGQKVTLRLGEGTKAAKLVAEEYDIALALKYKSQAAGDNDKTEYKSAYVFATDQGVVSIQEGSIIEFQFNEALIDEVTGVEVIAMNGLEVAVDAGNIICSTIDEASGNTSIDHWYSMGEYTVMGKGATSLPITSTRADDYNSLKRAKFNFTTTYQSGIIDSGGTAPIRMVIAYINTKDQTEQFVIDDIRDCATGGFTAGEDAQVDVFLSGAKSLCYIQLTPYDDDPAKTASWNLDNVRFSFEGGTDSSEHTIPIERTLYEREDTLKTDGDVSNYINVSTMVCKLRGKLPGATADSDIPETVSVAPDTTLNLVLGLGEGNTSSTYAYIMDRVTGGLSERITDYTETSGRVNLTFENSTGDAQAYRLIFFSVQNPTMRAVLTVNVTPQKIEDDPKVDPVIPNDPNGGNENTNGENENTNGGNENTNGDNGNTNGDNGNTNGENNQESTGGEGDVGLLKNHSTRKKRKEEETSLDA